MLGKILIAISMLSMLYIYYFNPTGYTVQYFRNKLKGARSSYYSQFGELADGEGNSLFQDAFMGNLKAQNQDDPQYSCYYQKYCTYEKQSKIEQAKIQNGSQLKEFLINDMKKQQNYHYALNLASGEMYKDLSAEHKYDCNQDEFQDSLRVHCEYIDMATNSALIKISFMLFIGLQILLI